MPVLNFNAATVEPSKGMDPVPTDWYNVVIDESEMKPTKDTKGMYLQFRYSILDGDFKGRKLFDRLNLQNANATAVQIAEENLSAICHSVNVIVCETSEMLHNIPFQIKAVLRPPKGEYEASNDVKGYKALDGSTGAATGADAGSSDPAWAAKGDEEEVIEEAVIVEEEAVVEDGGDGDAVTGDYPDEADRGVVINKDSDYTYEELIDNEFNEQEMIDNGYAKKKVVKKAPAKAKAPVKKTPAKKTPAKKVEPEATVEDATESEAGDPPWAQKGADAAE